MTRDLLVLVHIPKTAGTTLWRLMEHHYPRASYRIGNAIRRPDGVERGLSHVVRKPGIRAAAGHVPFGILSERLPPESRYVAILRDPVERTLSHYAYVVDPPPRSGAGLVPPWLPRKPRGLALEDCLEERGYIPNDFQTRMLCGIASPYDPLPPDALERATRNLRERFAYVGTTERFDELLALLTLELGWPTVAYEPARPNPNRLRREDLSPETLRRVEEWTALDRELHAFATRLLEEALERVEPAVALR
jgi:hypothetical protein